MRLSDQVQARPRDYTNVTAKLTSASASAIDGGRAEALAASTVLVRSLKEIERTLFLVLEPVNSDSQKQQIRKGPLRDGIGSPGTGHCSDDRSLQAR